MKGFVLMNVEKKETCGNLLNKSRF